MALIFRLFTVLIVTLSFIPAKASSNSFDLWGNATLNLQKDKWTYHSMINPRLNDNWSRFDRNFIRNGVGYQINKNLSIMLGQDWFLINQMGEDTDSENRIWQQAQIVNEIGRLNALNRLRLEERFLETEFIVSLRWLLRLEYPVFNLSDLYLVIANEFFVDLNKDFSYAEDRVFIGLNKKFTKNINLDFGYQLRHINQELDVLSHALLFNLVYNLDM